MCVRDPPHRIVDSMLSFLPDFLLRSAMMPSRFLRGAARCGGHLAKGKRVIDRAIATTPRWLRSTQLVFLDKPTKGGRVDCVLHKPN